MKKFLAIILTICLVCSCFAACGNNNGKQQDISGTSSSGTDSLKVPQEDLQGVKHHSFSKFTAIDLAGNKFDQNIFKGKKLTMINIWATFCRPCINEMPDLEILSKEYAEKGLQVIGIICDVTYSDGVYNKVLLEDALNIIEQTGVTYTSLLPSESLNEIKLSEVYSVPETIFVDENGNIVGESYVGSRSLENWKTIVDSIMSSMVDEKVL